MHEGIKMPENSLLMPTISVLFIHANILLFLNLSFGSHFGGHFEFEVCDEFKNVRNTFIVSSNIYLSVSHNIFSPIICWYRADSKTVSFGGHFEFEVREPFKNGRNGFTMSNNMYLSVSHVFLALLLADIGLILKLSVLAAILAAILKNKHVRRLGFSVTFSMSFYSRFRVKKHLNGFYCNLWWVYH